MDFSLYPSRLLVFSSFIKEYLLSISLHTHFKANIAFFGSVTTGVSKWAISLDTGDNELLFKYNGTTVFKLGSNGAVTSANNVTAFGTSL